MNKQLVYSLEKSKLFIGHHLFTSQTFLVVLFLFFLAIRVIHLSADPPKNLSWSLGLFFDEGIYNHNARNQILFGQWKLDEWNDFYYSPISALIKYLVFRIIGVGRIQMRLLSVMFSLVSLLFGYLSAKESYGKRTGLLAVLFLGTNYIYLMYNRLGMQDTPTLAIFIIAFYCWQKGINTINTGKEGWYFFLAGVFCVITYTFKNLFLYVLPTPFVALGLYMVFQSHDRIFLKKLFKAFGYLSIGCVVGVVIWFITFYLPYRDSIAQFGSYIMSLMFPTLQVKHLITNISQTPLFQYFSNSPVILLGSFLFLWYLYYCFCSERRVHMHPSDIFLAVWFWAAFVFSGIIAYRPTRYFLPIIPPMCLLAARLISSVGGISRVKCPKKLHWGFFPISIGWLTLIVHYVLIPWSVRYIHILRRVIPVFGTRSLIISGCVAIAVTVGMMYVTVKWRYRALKFPKRLLWIIAGILIASSLYMNGKFYYRWARFPQYVVSNIGKELPAFLGSNAYIGGMDSVGVAFDTPYKTLFSWDQFVNYAENPITKYQLTHLFLADSSSVPETQYYFQRYPREMQKATLLQQYIVKDTTFNLFSLVEPKAEEVFVEKTTLSIREPLSVKISMKNYDFRQSKKLYLNWFLYPLEVKYVANPIGIGQETQYWLLPEQEKKFSISGSLPEHPGHYQLLIGWKTVQEQKYEAEDLEHHLGHIVDDIHASGNRVVYHDITTFPDAGFLTYGGYQDYQPGIYEASFRLKIGDSTIPDEVVRIDVVADYGKVILQQREIRGTDFSDTNRYQRFILPYTLTDYSRKVEFRVFSYGKADMWADDIHLFVREGMWYNQPIVIQ